MSYDILEKTYNSLTEDQQLIVYNLALSLCKLNIAPKMEGKSKREFGQFSNSAKVSFSDNWETTEEELCDK